MLVLIPLEVCCNHHSPHHKDFGLDPMPIKSIHTPKGQCDGSRFRNSGLWCNDVGKGSLLPKMSTILCFYLQGHLYPINSYLILSLWVLNKIVKYIAWNFGASRSVCLNWPRLCRRPQQDSNIWTQFSSPSRASLSYATFPLWLAK